MAKGRYEDRQELFCNKCNCNIDKFIETEVINHRPTESDYGEVYCHKCHNWLCGEFDAFGEFGRIITRSPIILKLELVQKLLREVTEKIKLES